MKSYDYSFLGKDYKLGFYYESEEDPYFADLTVNIMILLPFAAVINDQLDPNICNWLESIGAGRPYRDKVHCNYGEYPLFQFDPEFLEHANPESYAGLLT